jgi:hypothetical protein
MKLHHTKSRLASSIVERFPNLPVLEVFYEQ